MKILRIVLAVVLSAVSVLGAFAGRTRTVMGEYTYALPSDMSIEEGRHIAMERAIIEALAAEFGTLMIQENSSRIETIGGSSQTDFYSIGRSIVKGEWIETIGEPEFSSQIGDDGVVFITCKVKGKARERESADVSFAVSVLCNGQSGRYASSEFKNGDNMYLQFMAPTDGYLAVYLVDADGNVFTMLPYMASSEGAVKVQANKNYIFFSRNSVPYEERAIVDEYRMETNRASEYNTIYIVFSEKSFVKAIDNAGGESQVSGLQLPRQQKFEAFQEWLTQQRSFDDRMQVETLTIRIVR